MGSCTTKIPPLFNGLTSLFKYEEQIDDWLDLTVLEVRKRAPALKNRRVGDAEMYKGRLAREPLTAPDGVKYFKDTLRLRTRSSECFALEMLSIFAIKKMKYWDGQVDRQVHTAPEASKKCLDGHVSRIRHVPRKYWKTEKRWRSSGFLWSRDQRPVAQHTSDQSRKVISIFWLFHDVHCWERKTYKYTLSRGMSVPAYTLEATKTVFMDLFCTPNRSMQKNPSPEQVDTAAVRAEPSS